MANRLTKHRTVAVDVGAIPDAPPRGWPWPWYVAAVAGPLGVLLAGWLVLSALTAIGWLTSPDAQLPDALRLAADVVLLAHGAPVQIGGQAVAIAPLGFTAGLVFLALPIASFAARQAASLGVDPDDTGKIWADTEAIVYRVGGTFAAVYTAGLLALASTVGAISLRALLGGVVVGGVSGLWGAARGVGYDPSAHWPGWLRSVPRALGAALLMVMVGASLVLAAGVWLGRARIETIIEGLDGGIAGLILLIVLHLIYLPNFILASASWMLGAGVTVGDQSLVTMALTDVGFMPAIPIFGVVPAGGEGSSLSYWWLLVGAAAGIVAALAVAWARPRARFDETALVGGLSGVVAGLALVVACALGSGSLGSDRLAHIGARLPELAIFAPTLLGLSGMAAGLVLGLIRRP